jgi:hypothetical protein
VRIAVSTCLNRGFGRRATFHTAGAHFEPLLAARAMGWAGDRIQAPRAGCGSYIWVAEGVAWQERHGTIADDGERAARTKPHTQGRRRDWSVSSGMRGGGTHAGTCAQRRGRRSHAHSAASERSLRAAPSQAPPCGRCARGAAPAKPVGH